MSKKNLEKYIIFEIEEQYFCMPAVSVEDVILPQIITPVPLSPHHISGILNLRGRVVTMIDLRICLSLSPTELTSNYRGIVFDNGEELYGFMVDRVKEVVDLENDTLLSTPETISDKWKHLSRGVFTHSDRIIVALDAEKIIDEQSVTV